MTPNQPAHVHKCQTTFKYLHQNFHEMIKLENIMVIVSKSFPEKNKIKNKGHNYM